MILDTSAVLATRGTILSGGYVTLDVIVDSGVVGHRAGGTAANVAANLAYFGWEADLAGVIGRDPAGVQLSQDLVKANVSTRHLTRLHEVATPIVVHEILGTKHRFRFDCPECGRRFPRHHPLSLEIAEPVASSCAPDVFFFDRVSPGTLVLATSVREAGGLVVFEPATRGRSEHFELAARLAHIVKCSRQRLRKFGDLLKPPIRGRQLQIVTDGRHGLSWRTSLKWRKSAAFAVRVVDSGGAGDWTTAAMLAALPSLDPEDLHATDFEEVLRTAQAVAAISCGAVGARGMSDALKRDELGRTVGALVGNWEQPRTLTSKLPRRARRRTLCGSCLA